MFESQKSSGSGYTTTVALLSVALIFSPAALVISRPFGYVSLSLAIACSAICLTLAWVNWKKLSQIRSATVQRAAAK